MHNKIKCIFINVNSLVSKQKRHFFNVFLTMHKPDVVLIAEHRLNIRHKLNFKGYRLLRQHRNGGVGGGTAICIKESFSFQEIKIDTKFIENSAIEVSLSDGGKIAFVAMYKRPTDLLTKEDLNKILCSLNTNQIVLTGDLNAKHPDWRNTTTNPAGATLSSWLNETPTIQLIPTKNPTRVSSGTFIDVVMISPFVTVEYETNFLNCLKTLDYESDHDAVQFELLVKEIVRKPTVQVFDWSKTNFSQFNELLEQELTAHTLPMDRNVTIDEIDSCIGKLNEVMESAIDCCVPKVSITKKSHIKIPQNILNFMSERKRLRRQIYRCVDPQRKMTLIAIRRSLNKIIQELLIVHEDEYWANYFKKIKMNNQTYRKIKNLCGLKGKKEIPSLVDANGSIINENFEKINVIADSFENTHMQNLNIGSPSFANYVKNAISDLLDRTPIFNFNSDFLADGLSTPSERDDPEVISLYEQQFTNPQEIEFELFRKNNKRSFGEDGVSNFLLRKTNYFLWQFLSILFNHAYNLGYFPVSWKCAKVVPVLKPKSDAKDPKNYRPISMLSNISKLFEGMLTSKIKTHCKEQKVFKDFQFGFRNKHSTTHALTILSDYVSTNLNRRIATIAVSLDFEKAFDTAWIEGIVFKMYKIFNFSKNTCRIIYDYLTKRSFYVTNNDENSIEKDIMAGVPQGSLLGPILYNIFLADLPEPTGSVRTLVYADDILILASKPKVSKANTEVNEYLSELDSFFEMWKLKLNINKCDCVAFKGLKTKLYPSSSKFVPDIKIKDCRIKNTDRIKYLGVVLHQNFQFHRHIDYVLSKAKTVFFSSMKIIKTAKDLKSRIKLNCYKQIIRPILTYSFPIWFDISSSQMERLRAFERRILRVCSGINYEEYRDGYRKRIPNNILYKKCEIERIDYFMVKTALKFLNNLNLVENDMLKDYANKQNEITYPIEETFVSPIYLKVLNENNNIFENNKVMYYHRRFKTRDINNTVYSVSQYIGNNR